MLLDVSPAAGPGGAVAGERGTRDRSGKSRTAAGSGGPATTDEQAELTALINDASAAPDPETLRRAREIAAQLALRRPRRAAADRRGPGGVLASVPYRGGADDIDLDATVAKIAGPVGEAGGRGGRHRGAGADRRHPLGGAAGRRVRVDARRAGADRRGDGRRARGRAVPRQPRGGRVLVGRGGALPPGAADRPAGAGRVNGPHPSAGADQCCVPTTSRRPRAGPDSGP